MIRLFNLSNKEKIPSNEGIFSLLESLKFILSELPQLLSDASSLEQIQSK